MTEVVTQPKPGPLSTDQLRRAQCRAWTELHRLQRLRRDVTDRGIKRWSKATTRAYLDVLDARITAVGGVASLLRALLWDHEPRGNGSDTGTWGFRPPSMLPMRCRTCTPGTACFDHIKAGPLDHLLATSGVYSEGVSYGTHFARSPEIQAASQRSEGNDAREATS